LTGDNVLFDDDAVIHICDFRVKSLKEVANNSDAMAEVGGSSGKHWRPDVDVKAFTELLSRIVIGDSAEKGRCSLSVARFVLEMIERRQVLDSDAKLSFVDIFETLKDNEFRILDGVDLTEVSNFVRWIEFSEALTE
jgi:hypothetical protein